jgi:hypothetical protein
MSQKLEGTEYDVRRTARMILWGSMFAPIAHGWYNALEARLPAKGASTVIKKVLADQVGLDDLQLEWHIEFTHSAPLTFTDHRTCS